MGIPSTKVDENGRVCVKCKDYKLWSEFDLHSSSPGCRRSECRECRKKHRKGFYLLTNYGIDEITYKQLFVKQNSQCGICGTKITQLMSEGNVAHVDHCHKTGKVRGLLCFNCNQGLGNFRDDFENLLKAASWIKENL